MGAQKNIQQEVKKKKQTYKQNWPAYDKAKCNEPCLIQTLVKAITANIPDQDSSVLKKGRGRPKLSPQQQVRMIITKEYHQKNNRHTSGILSHQGTPSSHKSISNAYNNVKLHAIFEQLILASSLPLAAVETIGGIDATGFSTRAYDCWDEKKWRHPTRDTKKMRKWVKLHAFVGTKTNIIISATITDSNKSDHGQLQEVVGKRTDYFSMKEFVADKAYLSRETYQFIHELGLVPYIPFKSNVTGKPKGVRIWREMWDHFNISPDEYNQVYHQRSNVETVFHMLKSKFGSRLHMKNFVAQKNEILARILIHNLCVLIQESYETGLDISQSRIHEAVTTVHV